MNPNRISPKDMAARREAEEAAWLARWSVKYNEAWHSANPGSMADIIALRAHREEQEEGRKAREPRRHG